MHDSNIKTITKTDLLIFIYSPEKIMITLSHKHLFISKINPALNTLQLEKVTLYLSILRVNIMTSYMIILTFVII